MIELSSKIFEVLQSGNILWLAVFLVVASITNASKFFDFLEGRKKAKIKRLQEVAACNLLDDGFKEFVTHEIQREYFLYIANISGEKQFRDRLFEIHKAANGNLPFFHFRRASSFMKYENDDVKVKVDFMDKLSYIVNTIGFILFLFLGLAFFLLITIDKPTAIMQVLSLLAGGFAFLGVAMLFASQTFPLYSAKKVKAEIEKQKSQKASGADGNG